MVLDCIDSWSLPSALLWPKVHIRLAELQSVYFCDLITFYVSFVIDSKKQVQNNKHVH